MTRQLGVRICFWSHFETRIKRNSTLRPATSWKLFWNDVQNDSLSGKK